MENLPGVHLHTSRVKLIESLIEKIITKCYQRMFDKDSGYADISAETYKSVVTDLVGLRIIINYRGHWLEMHKQILERFPYDETQQYKKHVLIPVMKEEYYGKLCVFKIILTAKLIQKYINLTNLPYINYVVGM